MIPYGPLQRLRAMDTHPQRLHKLLIVFLRGNENRLREIVRELPSEYLAQLVEYLDNALIGISDHASPAFRESLHELMKVCSIAELLPKSCILSRSHLVVVLPSASGLECTLDGSVRVIRLKPHPENDAQKAKETLYQVAVMWKHLTHHNIVPLLGATTNPLQLVMDWTSDEDLKGYIANHDDANKYSLLSDVAGGLSYLHSCSVIHGDLDGSNVLVDSIGRARIAGFGLVMVARDLDVVRGTASDRVFKIRWVAPEILDGRGTCSMEADVFSFAGVTIEAFTGDVPFCNRAPDEAVLAIVAGERPERPTSKVFIEEIWKLTQQCWYPEARLRPKASWILKTLSIPVWERLINRPLPTEESISLVEAIFSDPNETEAVKQLCGHDAQAFVDLIDKLLETEKLVPPLQTKCLGVLRKICGSQLLIPRSAQIPLLCDRSTTPLYRGGFADVCKCRYQGSDVAVKLLAVSMDTLGKAAGSFCREVVSWKALRHPNVQPLLGATMDSPVFAMISSWMENGNIMEFIKTNKEANRFKLLEDVASGLIYIHGWEMVHGDLKGANILIDQSGTARIADFGFLTMVSDSSKSIMQGGTARWMSPELFYPEEFDLSARPTKESDSYALGMLIFEVLSGRVPFAGENRYHVIVQRIAKGERPKRPKGAWFTDDLWETLERCWSHQPAPRPAIETVLKCLERQSLRPSAGVDCRTGGTDLDYAISSHSQTIPQGTGQSSLSSLSFSLDMTIQTVTRGDEVLPLSTRPGHNETDSFGPGISEGELPPTANMEWEA